MAKPKHKHTQPAATNPGLWPAMPDFSTPEKLQEALARFGVTVPTLGTGMPSVADGVNCPALSRLTHAPTFAHLWDMDQKLGGVAAACSALNLANAAYQQLSAKPGCRCSRTC